MVRKTKALIEPPPLISFCSNKIANNDATDADTIPRGATHAKKNFCRQFIPLFHVQMRILSGRTINIKANTVNTLPHPKANTLAIDKSAAKRINKTETPRIVNCPLKRKSNLSAGISEAFKTIPAITVAINPDSLTRVCETPKMPQTKAKTTKFFNSSEIKCTCF